MKNIKIPKIMITPGEPAGIGPDITIKIAQQSWPAELIVVADPNLLISRAKQLKLPLTLIPFDEHDSAKIHQAGTLKIVSVDLKTPCEAGKLEAKNASYVLRCLEIAATYALEKKVDAIVTGPVHKRIMNDAKIQFTGHTEFFAAKCGVPEPVMLFVTPKTKVALTTTHLALSSVPKAITGEKLKSILRILHHELKTRFHIQDPHILVCGLNPHAGENGYLGREEIDVIEPALRELRNETMKLTGPLPADTLFTQKQLKNADAVLAMYHDQALPVVKYMSFGSAVNLTLGLPILRTSVDHGTAIDVAGTKKADHHSLAAAIQLAIELASDMQ